MLVHSAFVSHLYCCTLLINHYLHSTFYTLRFDPHVAHAAYDVVSGFLTAYHGYYFNRAGGIVGTQDQVTVRGFDITDDASSVFTNGVYVTFAPAVGGQRIVVAVEQ